MLKPHIQGAFLVRHLYFKTTRFKSVLYIHKLHAYQTKTQNEMDEILNRKHKVQKHHLSPKNNIYVKPFYLCKNNRSGCAVLDLNPKWRTPK